MAAVVSVIGGIGFFLLGMSLMADGLKGIAGDSLRKLLNRFTGGTVSSIVTGAILTLLLQSSTATSLMTIGFVSAGMLSFVQATGIIFGANLGTTSTGWMVAFIGLKFSISQLALPIVGIGVLLKQFSSGRWALLGHVLAGIGLIFVGIQFLQDGMAGLDAYLDLSLFAGESVGNRLLLILIGIIMTVIMQSSSAAVATTITVLASGAIGLEHAVALVIGQNIGTTATVAIAAIGASVSAKRTAMAHILFNAVTGAICFLFFPYLVLKMKWLAGLLDWHDPAIILAMFHTYFSLLGIAVLAPFIGLFTKGIIRMLPEKKSAITMHLDSSVISLPAVATETAMRALKEAAIQTLTATHEKFGALLSGLPANHPEVARFDRKLQAVKQEMGEIHSFVAAIRADSAESAARYGALLHASDHIGRLNRLVTNNLGEVKLTDPSNQIYGVVSQLAELIRTSIEALREGHIASVVPQLTEFSRELAEFRKKERAGIFEETARGELHAAEALQYVRLILFVDGVSYHLWRMMHHLDPTPQTDEPDNM